VGSDASFLQTLSLQDGTISITDNGVTLTSLVRKSDNTVQLKLSATTPFTTTVSFNVWRDDTKPVFYGGWCLKDDSLKDSVTRAPDVLIDSLDYLGIFHRNAPTGDFFEFDSLFESSLQHQGLAGGKDKASDPLSNVAFGVGVNTDNSKTTSSTSMTVLSNENNVAFIDISVLKVVENDTVSFESELSKVMTAPQSSDFESSRQENELWWGEYFDRSFITLTNDENISPEQYRVSQQHVLHRYTTACQTSESSVIKFNGGIFNVHPGYHNDDYANDPDFRDWGGATWQQNTRHTYWPMLASGDFDQMLGLFEWYTDQVELSKYRVNTYFGHDGIMIPETHWRWGGE